MLVAEGGPYMGSSFNLCENTPAPQNRDLVRECKTEDGITSYFARMNRGDLVYTKNYYLDGVSAEWYNVQVEVDLLIGDFEAMSADDTEEIELNEEQLRRIEIAEGIAASLKLK